MRNDRSDALYIFCLPQNPTLLCPTLLLVNPEHISTLRINSTTMDPKVGIGVFAMNAQGKFVLGERKGSHGAGESWQHRHAQQY